MYGRKGCYAYAYAYAYACLRRQPLLNCLHPLLRDHVFRVQGQYMLEKWLGIPVVPEIEVEQANVESGPY